MVPKEVTKLTKKMIYFLQKLVQYCKMYKMVKKVIFLNIIFNPMLLTSLHSFERNKNERYVFVHT